MLEPFYRKALELQGRRQVYVEATVIAVRGSSSAKTGARALISDAGQNLWGWVGGGCAESFIIKQSLEALKEHRPRIVTVDLDDELLGVGMPCGGYMDVYLQPVFPPADLWIYGADGVAAILARLAPEVGFSVTLVAQGADASRFPLVDRLITGGQVIRPPSGAFVVCLSDRPSGDCSDFVLIEKGLAASDSGMVRALGLLGRARALVRGADERVLSLMGPRPVCLPPDPELVIVGRGRIAEELARLGVLLGLPVRVNDADLDPDNYPQAVTLITNDLDLDMADVGPNSCVILAGQHKGDHRAALGALGQGAGYIGLIASRKRAGLILEYLRQNLADSSCLDRFFAPAGLDLGAISPFDIALSLLLQILGQGE